MYYMIRNVVISNDNIITINEQFITDNRKLMMNAQCPRKSQKKN